MIQLQRLLDQFSFTLADISYHRELLDSFFSQAQADLLSNTKSQIQALTSEFQTVSQTVSPQISTSYRKTFHSLDSELRSLFQKHSHELSIFEHSFEETIREMFLTIRQLGHNVVTASNAFDVQWKLTVREIENKLKMARDSFQSGISEHEKTMAGKFQARETEENDRLNTAAQNHAKDMKVKVKFPIRRFISKDRFTRFSEEISELKTTLIAIVSSAHSQMTECSAKVRAIVAEIVEESGKVEKKEGTFVTVLKLDVELNDKIEGSKQQASEIMDSKRDEVEELKREIEITRARNIELLENKATEMLDSAQMGHCALNDLLKVKSDELRRLRDHNRKVEDEAANCEQFKRRKFESADRWNIEKATLAEQKKLQTAQLSSLQYSDKSQ
jgi:hypothetical protein